MTRLLLCLWLCLVAQAPLHAGPWLQEPGKGFLSFSNEIVTSGAAAGTPFATAYAEFGLHERITLGFDLGGSNTELYKAVVFAKTPITWFDGDLKAAVELGFGITEQETILRPGITFGRGFPLGARSGWMAIDTLAHVNTETGYMDVTTDMTFGVNMSERAKLILQVQSGHQLMELDFLKFAPSYVYERKPGQHIELGMLAGLENAEDFSIKLGLWHSF